jgi:hypothetical protein
MNSSRRAYALHAPAKEARETATIALIIEENAPVGSGRLTFWLVLLLRRI